MTTATGGFRGRKPARGAEADKASPDEAAAYPGLAARAAAGLVLADVIAGGHNLDERVGNEEPTSRLAGLPLRDRALARSIATVALRRLGTIRRCLARLMERGLPKQPGGLEWTLLVGAAQILFLDIPDHAAVDLAVRAVRLDQKTAPFAALVNGVLRNLARERESMLAEAPPDIDAPAWLLARWRKHYGADTAAKIVAAHRDEPTLDVSVKSDPEGWARRLGGIALPTGSVRLSTHEPVADLPGYGDGEWWVQDAGAALPARLLAPIPGMRIADLCAAPGGKCAQLAAMGAQVVAVDRSAERLKRLNANMERLRLSVEAMVGDAASVRAQPFDAVLIDAPCSATGTIRRHPDVAWTKRATDLATLGQWQARILDHAASLLKPSAALVYCTCSLEPEEGEAQIAALLRRNPDLMRHPARPEELPGLEGCISALGEVRTLPFHLAGPEPRLSGIDGFFISRLVRRG